MKRFNRWLAGTVRQRGVFAAAVAQGFKATALGGSILFRHPLIEPFISLRAAAASEDEFRSGLVEWVVMGRLTLDGVKCVRLSPDQAAVMAATDLTLPWRDYRQPFPAIAVVLPDDFPAAGPDLPRPSAILLHHDPAAGVLLVASAGLGTLNSAALTAEALKARGLPLIGVIIGALAMWWSQGKWRKQARNEAHSARRWRETNTSRTTASSSDSPGSTKPSRSRARGRLLIPVYWAPIVHEGRSRPILPRNARVLVWFRNPLVDDPRLRGGYPKRLSEVRSLRSLNLSADEWKDLKESGRIIFSKRVDKPVPPTPFFGNDPGEGMSAFAFEATRVVQDWATTEVIRALGTRQTVRATVEI